MAGELISVAVWTAAAIWLGWGVRGELEHSAEFRRLLRQCMTELKERGEVGRQQQPDKAARLPR